MELTKIVIRNFRSVKEEEVKFAHNCLVLLGKNEAGKSNILKAIAAGFGNYKVTDKDKRKRIDNEKISEYKIIVSFDVSKAEHQRVVQMLSKKYININILKFKEPYNLETYLKKITLNFYMCWKLETIRNLFILIGNLPKKTISMNQNGILTVIC